MSGQLADSFWVPVVTIPDITLHFDSFWHPGNKVPWQNNNNNNRYVCSVSTLFIQKTIARQLQVWCSADRHFGSCHRKCGRNIIPCVMHEKRSNNIRQDLMRLGEMSLKLHDPHRPVVRILQLKANSQHVAWIVDSDAIFTGQRNASASWWLKFSARPSFTRVKVKRLSSPILVSERWARSWSFNALSHCATYCHTCTVINERTYWRYSSGFLMQTISKNSTHPSKMRTSIDFRSCLSSKS